MSVIALAEIAIEEACALLPHGGMAVAQVALFAYGTHEAALAALEAGSESSVMPIRYAEREAIKILKASAELDD